MRIGPATAAALLVTGLTAGTANATVTTNTGALTYTCTFPGVAPQPTTLMAHLDVTDPHPGQPFTVTPYATVVYSAAVKSLLGALGYDQVRGSISTTFSVSDATPAAGVLSGAFPANPFTSGSVIGSPQVFTAGAAGSVGFAMGTGISESLELHKKSTGTWTPWSSSCTLKVTSPAQNTAFSPSIAIS
ncbi:MULTISPECIES: hypothetical protein [unclassified Amycolatopsis]|uniref:hypothetical protein n=1 Tax=unclassified Amycolatopsis TaxID=2618356 RepID=UPI001FF29D28|nr:hypothetical protein [Amycolatopsis sp. FBCC-B4732]UOX85546.1 hypothetical protein MUY14_27625 [Amycolatopsis sp. FBCC-B4732]